MKDISEEIRNCKNREELQSLRDSYDLSNEADRKYFERCVIENYDPVGRKERLSKLGVKTGISDILYGTIALTLIMLLGYSITSLFIEVVKIIIN